MATILVELLGNATQLKAELASAQVATAKANGGFAKISKAAGVAGLALAGGLAVGLVKSVEAADAAQQATARMNTAFAASHVSVKAFAGAIEDAEGKGRKLGFTNEDVKGSLGSLIVATHNGAAAIRDLGVAQDIARFKHVSLETATKSLTMAMAGSQRATKALGIDVPKVTSHFDALKATFGKTISPAEKVALAHATIQDKMATSNKVIATVTQKLHGQAAAFAGTAAGGMAQFHAQLGDLAEKIGTALLPALTSVANALASGAAFFSEHTTLTKGLVIGLGALAAILLTVSVATKLFAAGQAIVAAATGVWTAAQWLLNVALDANPIGIVVIAIAALVGGLILAYTHSATFRQIVTDALNAVSAAAQTVIDFFSGAWAAVQGLITAPFDAIVGVAQDAFGVASAIFGAFQTAKNWLVINWPIIATIISGPFAPLVALATNAFGIRDKLTGAFEAVVNWVKDNWVTIIGALIFAPFAALILLVGSNAFGIRDRLTGAFQDVKDWLGDKWDAVKGLITGPFDAIVTAAKDAFGVKSAVSTALGDVVGFFKDLPGKILGALGDVSHLLYNAGASIIQGLIDGLTSKLGEVKSLVGGIAGTISGLKGPIEADRVLLVPHGQAIIQGLQSGLESGLGGLNRMTAGIAPTISANVAGAPLAAPVGGGNGGGNVTINITGMIGDEQVEQLRNILIRTGRATSGGALGGFA